MGTGSKDTDADGWKKMRLASQHHQKEAEGSPAEANEEARGEETCDEKRNQKNPCCEQQHCLGSAKKH